jgi:acyl-CoA reductase-like NAD-dependent aldehyde dehydrogenase
VSRLIDTFRIAAEESVRMTGEVQPLDISKRAKGYMGIWKRVPIGPCSFISPFNFPLNLAAHKIAPAIAVGCPFVMKPASRTPLGAIIMGEVLAETDLPKGAFSILPAHRDGADCSPRTTAETAQLHRLAGVGWDSRPGRQEEGGAGARRQCRGDRRPDADLADAVERIVFGAFYQSGQSCIGVQRIIIHEAIYDDLRTRLVAKTKTLVAGNPHDRKTFIGR